jgi:hypothetical protein
MEGHRALAFLEEYTGDAKFQKDVRFALRNLV